MRVALLLLLSLGCFTLFTDFEGIKADPCSFAEFGVQGPLIPPKPVCRSGPVQEHTLWLPSVTSPNLAADIVAGTHTVTINGVNLDDVISLFVGRRETDPATGLETGPAVSCAIADIDGEYNIVAAFSVQTTGSLEFDLPTVGAGSWISVDKEIQSPSPLVPPTPNNLNGGLPRPLCAFVNGQADPVFTGLYIGTAFSCSVNTECGNAYAVRLRSLPETVAFDDDYFREIESRTQCCIQFQSGLNTGACINPAAKSCCGDGVNAGTVQLKSERCCNEAAGTLAGPFDRCQCSGATGDAECPAPERCCLPTKYVEFDNDVVRATFQGECYRPTEERCCDTGAVYDPGHEQCCVINGLQSINIPCPCSEDEHCQGGQLEFQGLHMACCHQDAPTLNEADFPGTCTKYANFPTGQGQYNQQRCLGSCIDTRYQICCNGISCVKSYEKCCNSTCCNKFVGSCDIGIRSGTPGSRWNSNEFRVEYEQCTTIENLNPIKAMFVFVLPTYMLILSLGGLAIVLVFANKASNRSYNPIEQAMIVVAVMIIILSLSFYFSPMYKFGVLCVIAALIVILSAAARIFALNAWALVIIVLALLFMVDPFPANEWLNFTSFRNPKDGAIVPDAAGFLWAIEYHWSNNAEQCVRYYDYFRLDNQLRDVDRFDNPEITTFGYCERGWIIALLVFAVVVIILLVLLFFLTLIALLLRFRKIAPAPVALEVIKEPEVFVVPAPVFVEQPIFVPPPIVYEAPPVFCEAPPIIYEAPPMIYEAAPCIYEAPQVVYEMPSMPIIYDQPHLTPMASMPFFGETPIFAQPTSTILM